MSEAKPERLGLKGALTLIETTFRLVGAANATGAVAAGVAFNAFKDTPAHNMVKFAVILFLCGVLAFALAHTLWFITTVEIDHAQYTAKKRAALKTFCGLIGHKKAQQTIEKPHELVLSEPFL